VSGLEQVQHPDIIHIRIWLKYRWERLPVGDLGWCYRMLCPRSPGWFDNWRSRLDVT